MSDPDDIRSYDPDDVRNDPKFGPMLRQIAALDLPSAFDPADPDAPAEELPAKEQSMVATEGRNNARAAVVAKAPSTRAEQPPDENVLVQLPEPDEPPPDDEPPPKTDEFVQLPEGSRTAPTRIEPIPLKPRGKWLWLLLIMLVLGIAWAATSYFNAPAKSQPAAPSAPTPGHGTTDVESTAPPAEASTSTADRNNPPAPSSAKTNASPPPSTASAPKRPSLSRLPSPRLATSLTEPPATTAPPPTAPKPPPPPSLMHP